MREYIGLITSLEHEIIAITPPRLTAAVAGPAFLGTQTIKAPPIVPILIGETIYNLRATLDYLVYQLFYLDTGIPPDLSNRTQFPIVDRKQSWENYFPTPQTTPKGLKKMWLHKLSACHQADIKRLQPWFGCKWTAKIRDLSNPDKHRRFIATPITTSQPGGVIPEAAMVTVEITRKIAFEDTSPVMETLDCLQQKVADVIDYFDPDFK